MTKTKRNQTLSTREIKALIRFAKREGATWIKIGHTEIEFRPSHDSSIHQANGPKTAAAVGSTLSFPTSAAVLSTSAKELDRNSAIPSDEDFQFWSTPGPLPSELRDLEAAAHPNPEQAHG